MKLLLKEQTTRLIANYKVNQAEQKNNRSIDHMPVVKLFGGNACTWLLSEFDGEDTFFGLCDLGLGEPELGYVSKEELESLRFPPFRLPIERDRHFTPDKTLKEYTDEARRLRRINA